MPKKAKQRNRPFYLYDIFGMIPPPSDRDQADAHKRYAEILAGQSRGIADQPYYGYEKNLLAKVNANFVSCGLRPADHAIHFVPGMYEQTLWVDQPVAFAHIDCDWHDSVLTCLERITPRLIPGGVMVIDDYNDWLGCQQAVDSYFADKREQFSFTMKVRLQSGVRLCMGGLITQSIMLVSTRFAGGFACCCCRTRCYSAYVIGDKLSDLARSQIDRRCETA